jgi:hypothetical protein
MEELPNIPLEDLFKIIPLYDPPLRWFSVKSAMNILGVSERTIRNYIKNGKLQHKYKTIKGRKRVFISNRSVYALQDKKDAVNRSVEGEDVEDADDENPLLDALIGLGEIVARM